MRNIIVFVYHSSTKNKSYLFLLEHYNFYLLLPCTKLLIHTPHPNITIVLLSCNASHKISSVSYSHLTVIVVISTSAISRQLKIQSPCNVCSLQIRSLYQSCIELCQRLCTQSLQKPCSVLFAYSCS
jgi:hypothetical protein